MKHYDLRDSLKNQGVDQKMMNYKSVKEETLRNLRIKEYEE